MLLIGVEKVMDELTQMLIHIDSFHVFEHNNLSHLTLISIKPHPNHSSFVLDVKIRQKIVKSLYFIGHLAVHMFTIFADHNTFFRSMA